MWGVLRGVRLEGDGACRAVRLGARSGGAECRSVGSWGEGESRGEKGNGGRRGCVAWCAVGWVAALGAESDGEGVARLRSVAIYFTKDDENRGKKIKYPRLKVIIIGYAARTAKVSGVWIWQGKLWW